MPSSRNGTSMLQQHELLKQQAVEAYPAVYQKVITEWQQPGPDAFWLLYSANYLFRAGGVRWAIDPITLFARLSNSLPLHPMQDFSKLDFLILTHQHRDHVNWKLLESICSLPVPWIVPDFLVQECSAQTGIPRDRIIPAVTGQSIKICGIRILPLEGSHWEYPLGANRSEPPIKGLPSVSYLLEFHGKRWFFPGDVRSYDRPVAPDLGKLDGVAAHVWMGRMHDPHSDPPLFKQFCSYFSNFQSGRLILTHLYEMGRELKDIWTLEHAQKIKQTLADIAPSIKVDTYCTGGRVDI